MHRRTVAKIAMLVAISGLLLAWTGIWKYPAYALNPNASAIDSALGQLARAESAQTPSEVMQYIMIAKAELPESGSVSWWSPENINFEEIQARLDEIIIRAETISSFEIGDERYNTEMYAIHADIETIQQMLLAF
jgi:hypothetical protein